MVHADHADHADAPVTGSGDDGPPPGFMIAAVTLGVAGVAGVFAFAAARQTPPAPVAIGAVPAPQARSQECQALMSTLPDRLGEYQRAATADPTPPGTAAWRTDNGPIVLRCGLQRPEEFVVGAPIQMVNDVSWFRLDDPDAPSSTWLCVDRAAYVALTLPYGAGPGPIQAMSGVLDRTMPAIPIRPGPAR
jgi:hypothetical protein